MFDFLLIVRNAMLYFPNKSGRFLKLFLINITGCCYFVNFHNIISYRLSFSACIYISLLSYKMKQVK